MTLTKLPLSKWWIETNEVGEIVNTYNKAAITADIKSIQDTLSQLPNPSQAATDVADVLTAISSKWTVEKRSRIIELISEMYLAYQDEPQSIEIAQLTSKLNDLILLKERLI